MESGLTIIVGLLSIASAVGMLMAKEAVHSALYLIFNFACIAFLFLTLDAPFLAMVQIAVYAGAIMVLFLFVIMLLGADETKEKLRQFNWLPVVAAILASAFILIVGPILLEGAKEDTVQPKAENPQVRVINALSSFPDADFYLFNEAGDVVATFEGVRFGTPVETPHFAYVEPGTYTLRVANAGEDRFLPVTSETPLTLESNQDVTIVTYGTLGATMLALPEDLSYLDGRAGRLTVVNTSETTLDLVEVGSDFDFRETEAETAKVIAADLEQGSVFSAEYDAKTPYWAFVASVEEGEIADTIVARLRDFSVEDGQSSIVVVGLERSSEESLSPVVIEVVTPLLPQQGSPEQIGASLFIDYVLPFEMVAILLLAAMVGAIVLAQRGGAKPKPGRPTRRKVSRPLTSVIATQTGQQDVIGEPEQLSEPAGDQI